MLHKIGKFIQVAVGYGAKSATRLIAGGVVVATTSVLVATSAVAQTMPSTVRLLVGFPPGAGTDTLARIYADAMKGPLATNVVVENKPGAGGQIAAQQVKAATPDGSSLFFTVDHSMVMIPNIMKDPGFDSQRDFVSIARIATYNVCVAVHPTVPAKDLASYAALVKATPAQGNFGMPAPGSNAHFMGVAIGRHFQVPMNPVAYRGGAPAMADLIGGQLPALIMPCDALIEHNKAGRLRVIAAASEKRLAPYPEVQTFAEAGVKVPTDYFVGVWAPAATPKPVLDKLRDATQAIMNDKSVIDRINATGLTPAYGSAELLDRLVKESTAFWGDQMRQANFQPN